MVFRLDPRSLFGMRVRGAERPVAGIVAGRRDASGRAGAVSRAAALIVAIGLTLALTFAPFVFAREMNARAHAAISILMLGICLAFAYGVGFAPKMQPWRALWPWSVWGALVIGGVALMLFTSGSAAAP